MVVAGLWAASPAPGEDVARLTLVPAAQMAELAATQRSITRLVGEARDELAVAPKLGNGSLGPIVTNLDTATAQSRSLWETFGAVAVADGLSIPSAAFCAQITGAAVVEEDRVAVALARHQVEAMTQAMTRFRLEPAHGAVEALLSALDAESSGKGKIAEARESLTLARQRLAEALDQYSRGVLLPFADAIVKARSSATDPAEAERDCAPSTPVSVPPAPPVSAEPLAASVIEARRVAASAVLGSALDAIAAVTTPPEDLEGVPRYIGGVVRSPRKIRAVDPRYTGRAREACIEGMVILQAVITKAGTVRAVSVLKSLPGLTEAAVKAVRGWKFKPATLDGRPVEVYYSLTINFVAPAGCAGRISRPENPWQ